MKLSFQTIMLIVFGLFIVIGVAVFAGYIDLGGSKNAPTTPSGKVLMWGTVSKQVVAQFLITATSEDQTYSITYIEKTPETYENDLVQAFASGTGPDLFMITPDMFWRQKDKIFEIPYSSYPLATYTGTYMDVAKTYLTPTGILAFPVFIDPMIGYWNKDIFASVGLATAPKEWKEFPALSEKISIVADDYTIERSAFALGEYINIDHAKEILSLLILQTGDPITHVDAAGKLALDLGMQGSSVQKDGAAIALDFFGQFANPIQKKTYSWNKNFTSDKEQFLSGDLAYYLGFSSEITAMRRANPNLNFDITFVPQANVNGNKATVGKLYGIAISKQSKNQPLAYYALGDMVTPDKNGKFLAAATQAGVMIAPARRDMLPNDPANVYAGIFYQSALVSKTWIDPNAQLTSDIFRDMVSDLQSGKSNAAGAIGTARTKISAYLKTVK
jgi:spermidine/putrescine-binding protein